MACCTKLSRCQCRVVKMHAGRSLRNRQAKCSTANVGSVFVSSHTSEKMEIVLADELKPNTRMLMAYSASRRFGCHSMMVCQGCGRDITTWEPRHTIAQLVYRKPTTAPALTHSALGGRNGTSENAQQCRLGHAEGWGRVQEPVFVNQGFKSHGRFACTRRRLTQCCQRACKAHGQDEHHSHHQQDGVAVRIHARAEVLACQGAEGVTDDDLAGEGGPAG